MTAARFDVVLTAGAETDLEAIHDYFINQGAVEAAGKLLDDFLTMIATLETFPARRAMPKELEVIGMHNYRQILLGPYRVVYRVTGTRVIVTVIIDGRRDLKALLEQRLLRT